MIELPEAFKKKMMGLLETEYEAFLESYEKERVQGLRLNPGKAQNTIEILERDLLTGLYTEKADRKSVV